MLEIEKRQRLSFRRLQLTHPTASSSLPREALPRSRRRYASRRSHCPCNFPPAAIPYNRGDSQSPRAHCARLRGGRLGGDEQRLEVMGSRPRGLSERLGAAGVETLVPYMHHAPYRKSGGPVRLPKLLTLRQGQRARGGGSDVWRASMGKIEGVGAASCGF